jgi:hypothetical protein
MRVVPPSGMRVVPPTMTISSISSDFKSKLLSKRSLGRIDRLMIVESLDSLVVLLVCESQGCRYERLAKGFERQCIVPDIW